MVVQTKTYTPQEYLTLEGEAPSRNEYHNGAIVPMAGGTPEHNEIASNLLVTLKLGLKGKPYRVFISDQRLWIPARNLYTYPDVMVVAHPIVLQGGRKDTVTQPIAIVEVLSESTKNYDRDRKFAAYRTLPTFQEYLLIDQYRIHVEHYVKQSQNQWLFSEYDDREEQVSLMSLPVVLSIANIYETVDV